jgi:hypothetical protein
VATVAIADSRPPHSLFLVPQKVRDAVPLSHYPICNHCGNEECWGDDDRQDISCRDLSGSFLLSMRNATRDEVQRAMKVKGREIRNGLHFMSNFAKGALGGTGDVNFTFDDNGQVYIIEAMLDPTADNGKMTEFLWNRELLPAGCSDAPNSKLAPC